MKIQLSEKFLDGANLNSNLVWRGKLLKISVLPGAKLGFNFQHEDGLGQGLKIDSRDAELKRRGASLFVQSGGVDLIEVVDFYATPGVSVGEVTWEFQPPFLRAEGGG